ncbi:MAG: GNAT family N-acetyltransferase [Rhodoferax sp.]
MNWVIVRDHSPATLDAARSLFVEYARSLPVDLCFQGFAHELDHLPGEYAEPDGVLLLARRGDVWAGCCALRRLDAFDYPNAAEMKRLFVRPEHRRSGLGRMLAEAILEHARTLGYDSVLLDTLNEMEAARAMYADLGFVEIPPYYYNPIEGAHYLRVDL